jgi:hypothetical protein
MLRDRLILDASVISSDLHRRYFNYPGIKGEILQFYTISDWIDYLYTLCIKSNRVPIIHADQYHVALRIMMLAWADPGVSKAAELQALRSLEGALAQVYFNAILDRDQIKREREREKYKRDETKRCQDCPSSQPIDPMKYRPGLCRYLDHMASHDALPSRYHNEGKKKDQSALHNIRNALAHGEPFNNLPWGGLMESVRDVIEHAYRNYPEPDERLIAIQLATSTMNVPENKFGWFSNSSSSVYF